MKIKDFAAFFLLSILAFGSCSKDVATPGDNGSNSGFPKSQIGTSGNEVPCGFSVYESLQVKYGAKSWSYASGDAGTVILTDLGSDNYYVKFTNYAGFSLEWQGLSTTL